VVWKNTKKGCWRANHLLNYKETKKLISSVLDRYRQPYIVLADFFQTGMAIIRGSRGGLTI
ncbi:unnamed protein product, partial [Staurois parvus]